jgi:hypothetical protein
VKAVEAIEASSSGGKVIDGSNLLLLVEVVEVHMWII